MPSTERRMCRGYVPAPPLPVNRYAAASLGIDDFRMTRSISAYDAVRGPPLLGFSTPTFVKGPSRDPAVPDRNPTEQRARYHRFHPRPHRPGVLPDPADRRDR